MIVTESIITCPNCSTRKTEPMPLDACQYFYECASCSTLLRPKPGDCCVFCSYGNVACPPKQMGHCGVKSGSAPSIGVRAKAAEDEA
ncbi:MAG TPA: GDCCVxC domain-containing (seleno)protein [Alphaproteobacteria bacterium]